MATRALFKCKYCNHKPFKSALGLASHIAQVRRCSLLSQANGRVPLAPPPPLRQPLGNVNNQQPVEIQRKCKSTDHVEPEIRADAHDPVQNHDNPQPDFPMDPGQMHLDSDEDPVWPYGADDDTSQSSEESRDTESGSVAPDTDPVCSEALDNFREYVKWMIREYLPFDKHEVAAIRLLDLLRRKRATLDTYEEVMEWHLRTSGMLQPAMKLGDYVHYHSRKSIIKKLQLRYNGLADYDKPKIPKPLFNTKHTVLPVSKAKVELIYHDVGKG
jgi:hypothetical protein